MGILKEEYQEMEKQQCQYGYSGGCTPRENFFTPCNTFSVGIFPLVPLPDGKGTKRGKVVVRVKGKTSEPKKVTDKAKEIISLLEEGNYSGPKIVSVK